MSSRIIRIAVLATWGSLVFSGCTMRLDNPVQDEAPIGFSAESALLSEDATKTGSPKVYFTPDDRFFVYGTKTRQGNRYAVFCGDTVDTPNGSSWDYAPHRFWDFTCSSYDFLAIAGPDGNQSILCNPADAAGALSAQISYDPTVAQYDLMAACTRRRLETHTTTPVHFQFSHLLSAVSVVVFNDSPEMSITLDSYRFQNLCTQGRGLVEQNGDNIVISSEWLSPGYNTNRVLGCAPGATLTAGTRFPEAGTPYVTDLMIPQEFGLNLSYIPRLVLTYRYREEGESEDTVIETSVRLEEIYVKGSDKLITCWLPGVRYIYEIHIRMGGGVRVNVRVAPWEEVQAETPGITI
jgi:hypothetical protein